MRVCAGVVPASIRLNAAPEKCPRRCVDGPRRKSSPSVWKGANVAPVAPGKWLNWNCNVMNKTTAVIIFVGFFAVLGAIALFKNRKKIAVSGPLHLARPPLKLKTIHLQPQFLRASKSKMRKRETSAHPVPVLAAWKWRK